MADELTPTSDRQIATGTLETYAVTPPSTLEALTRGELDIQITTARRYPRSQAHFKQRVLTMVRLDAETARTMYYALPRRQRQDDGSMKRVTITGPSVRLAEVVANAWTNIRAGGRIIGETERDVTAQGVCHDLETNYAVAVEVTRPIVSRDGRRFSDDLIVLTRNAAAAIARRNAVFSVVPRSLIEPFVAVAMKVAAGDAKTLVDSRARALQAFAELGITAGAVCDKLERRGVDDIDLEDLALLSGLLTALHEGTTSVAAEFPTAAGPGESKLVETLRRRRGVDAALDAGGRGNEPPGSVPPATPPPGPTPPEPPKNTPNTAA